MSEDIVLESVLEVNAAEIRKTIQLLSSVVTGGVIEVRVPRMNMPSGRTAPASGYFDDYERLFQAIMELDGKNSGVYITLNRLNPEVLARSSNRVKLFPENATTDKDILRYEWLLIDIDPVRPAGISSTDEEKAAAVKRAEEICSWLKKNFHWPDPIVADSGNAAHLLYRVELPNNRESTELLRRVLEAISLEFSDDKAKVDKQTYKPSQLGKVYGTWVKKGDSLQNRPHRRSALAKVPDNLRAVTVDKLESLARMLPASNHRTRVPQNGKIDVIQFARKHALSISKEKAWGDAQLYELEECPFNPDHRKTARIIHFPGGGLHFGCFHDSCSGNGWVQLLQKLEPQLEFDLDGAKENLTDLGNAYRFVRIHGENLRYCNTLRKWLIWNGTYWKFDEALEVERLAQEVPRDIYRESLNERDPKQKNLQRWSKTSESAPRIKAMIQLAEPMLVVSQNKLNTDKYLFTCLNGTLDVKTGKFREPRRSDLITRQAAVNYSPGKDCPRWLEFLNMIFDNNQDIIAFIQRAVGYSITGLSDERCIFILYGTGSNGKTTLVTTISDLLGDYARRINTELLLAKKFDRIPNDVAALRSVRFAYAEEGDANRRLSEAQIKDMTGGGDLSARFLYGEYFQFKPEFKIWFSTNHKPDIRETANAIWDRVRLIPFTVRIPDEKRLSRSKVQAMFLEELSGIFNWVLEGAKDYFKEGLRIPEEVKNATQRYRSEMDALGEFFDERCIISKEKEVSVTDLFVSYTAYCEKGGEKPVGKRKFSLLMIERGFQKYQVSSGNRERRWKGIDLIKLEEWEENYEKNDLGNAVGTVGRNDAGNKGGADKGTEG